MTSEELENLTSKDKMMGFVKEILLIFDRYLKIKNEDIVSSLVIEKVVKFLVLRIDNMISLKEAKNQNCELKIKLQSNVIKNKCQKDIEDLHEKYSY